MHITGVTKLVANIVGLQVGAKYFLGCRVSDKYCCMLGLNIAAVTELVLNIAACWG